MKNEIEKIDSVKGTSGAVQKREITAFTGAAVGKCFNKV